MASPSRRQGWQPKLDVRRPKLQWKGSWRHRSPAPRTRGVQARSPSCFLSAARRPDLALEFYVEKLGFRVHTDARNGDYRWLTVQHPDQPSFQLGLFTPQAPTVDTATAQTLLQVVAKGAMPPLVLVVDDCRAACERMRAQGVEITQEPTERYGAVDASIRDPSGNGWKVIEGR
ncbi:MAG TPA: VOC family protein [Caulobacteraceae bacterium]